MIEVASLSRDNATASAYIEDRVAELDQTEISRITDTWERFVAGEKVDLAVLRPEIAQSWRRCRDEYHLSPTIARVPGEPKPL